MGGGKSRGSFRFWLVSLVFAQVLLVGGAARVFAQCPGINNHGWPQNSTVRYFMDGGLTEEHKRQIRLAANEWSRANSLNNSKVSFVEDTTGQNFSLRFQTGSLAPGNPAVFNGTYSGTTGTVISGVITYDPNNTFPGTNFLIADPGQAGYGTIVMKLVLHEMGHLMGLEHPFVPSNPCDQPDGATVMNYACGVNDQGNNIPTTIAACDQNAINSESIYPPITLPPPTVQIDNSSVANPFNEGGGRANVSVTRTGDQSVAFTVDFVTNDSAGLTACNVTNGVASPRCDYAMTVRTLSFAAGETQKTISIPLVDDGFAEGNESLTVSLVRPVGVTIGSQSTATVTIQDNETVTSGFNPIDSTAFFVRQHYIDFLGREPDAAGFQGWQDILNNCAPGNTACDRIEVSSGFFRSEEFQSRGYFVYRFYPAALGRLPRYAEFMPDIAKVSGFLDATQLEASKNAFVQEFMNRQEFRAKYDSLTTPTAYVDGLLQTAGLPNHPTRQFWINQLSSGAWTRAQVLRSFSESAEVYSKFYNEAFVVMQYFGYLRRDPDALYTTWVQTMNQTNGNYRIMINGFINSVEYRQRFGL